MTNSDAARAIHETIGYLWGALAKDTPEQEIYERLSDACIEWSLRPELANVATIIAKTWAEQRPTSALARGLLEEHLGGLGAVDELDEIEAGGQPRPLRPLADVLPSFGQHAIEVAKRMDERAKRRKKS